MARAVQIAISNSSIRQPVKAGRPARHLTLQPVPLRSPDGTLETEAWGPEWIKFLANSINRLMKSGELINQDGVIQVNPM
jgi:hypothetical protein